MTEVIITTQHQSRVPNVLSSDNYPPSTKFDNSSNANASTIEKQKLQHVSNKCMG